MLMNKPTMLMMKVRKRKQTERMRTKLGLKMKKTTKPGAKPKK